MSGLSEEQLMQIAKVASKSAIESINEYRNRQEERIFGLKSIASECGVSDDTLRVWVNKHKFPLDRDPRGYSVRRWLLERWLEERRQAVSHLRKKP